MVVSVICIFHRHRPQFLLHVCSRWYVWLLVQQLGEEGTRFYSFIQNKATHPAFLTCIETLAQVEKEKKGDEELVLRFFATKNARTLFKDNVRDWLDNYMEKILLKEIEFDYEKEEKRFNKLFTYLSNTLSEGSFVKYKRNDPKGGLAPAYYEAITIGTFNALDKIFDLPLDIVRKKIIATVQTDEFRQNTGPGANKRSKLEGRIQVIQDALLELTNE